MERILSEWLGQIQIFRSCTPEELQSISEIMVFKKVKKREVLFHEGDPCETIYFLNKGRIKVFKTTEDGREQIVNILSSGDMLPHVGLFGGSYYPATAEALADSEIYLMYVEPFLRLLLNSPTLTAKVLQELDGKIRELQERLSIVLNRDITDRIIHVLYSLAKSKGVKTDEGYQLAVDLTHQDVANMVGTSRETVSRVLGQLKKEDRIILTHPYLIVKD